MLRLSGQLPLPLPDAENCHPAEALSFGEDRWIAASLMQKAIRRGDVDLARRAAVSLYRLIGTAIWRRLVIVAFEDIGVGNEGALKSAADIAHQRAPRPGADDERAASCLAGKLASCPKDRTADYLHGAALHHPSLAGLRLRLHRAHLTDYVAILGDDRLPLPTRATAALFMATREVGEGRRFHSRGFEALHGAYAQLGAPSSLLRSVDSAARLTRDGIVVMAPLIRLAAFAQGRPPILDMQTPTPRLIGGLPSYFADKHVASGKAAIQRLVTENDQLRACLAAFVQPKQWRVAAATAAFYADAASVDRMLNWPGAADLARLGAEADLYRDGVPLEGVRPLIECVRANLDQLNSIRAQLLQGRLSRTQGRMT